MKKVLKRKYFTDVEEVKPKMAEALKAININKFKTCFVQWKKSLDRCIASNGEYFEGLNFKHVRINIQFLYTNSILGGPPLNTLDCVLYMTPEFPP